MNMFANLFRDTLEPVKEPTALDRAKQEIEWFQSQAEFWEGVANKATKQLGIDVKYWRSHYEDAFAQLEKSQEALTEIRAMGISSSSGTARAMARKASEALI